MNFNFRRVFFTGLLLAVVAFSYFPQWKHFEGETMGTTYHIKVYTRRLLTHSMIQKVINTHLDDINRTFSTYDPNSEISRFNNSQTSAPQKVSEMFYSLLKNSSTYYYQSKGAWDPTVWPLYQLWGFDTQVFQKPSQTEIEKTLTYVGFDKLLFLNDLTLQKQNQRLQLDLSSIAKGVAVDEIVDGFKKVGIKRAFIEIGGEVRVLGNKPDGTAWKVGINTPDSKLSQEVLRVVNLKSGEALATSGDYRRFFKSQEKKYSHIINPKTGYPIDNNIASVSIKAPTTSEADAWATALFGINAQDGVALIEAKKSLEVFYILRDKEGNFSYLESKDFF